MGGIGDFFGGITGGDLLSLGLSAWSGSKDRSAAKNAAYMGSLRGTVEQARAMGISPIAALGFSGYQPTLIGGQSELGSTLKDIVAKGQQRLEDKKKERVAAGSPERRILNAQARQAEADAGLAEQQLRLSRNALATSPGSQPTPSEGCSPDQPLYYKRWDPIGKKTVWHPNLRCWPELGEASGAGAVIKSKAASTTPYDPASGTRKSRRQRGVPRSTRGQ